MISPRYIWPTLSNYDDAFQNTAQNVHDPDIKQAKLRGDARIKRLNKVEKKYVSVYPMDSKNASWVVRCFFTSSPDLTPPPDIEERYQEINKYIASHRSQLPFLVKQEWIPRAVSINGEDFPFIKSRFISNAPLGEFLQDHHQKKDCVAALARQFLEIMNILETLHMAHGDLDITNILVCGSFPDIALRLVDFDCMYVPVPAFTGKQLYEHGHEHFQPVNKSIRKFDRQMDRFSALIIYLSLIALAENPKLWYRCKAHEEKKLLLGNTDFENLAASFAYKELRKQDNTLLQKCLLELDCSIKERRMPEPLLTISDANFVPHEPKPPYVPPRPEGKGQFAIPKQRTPVTPPTPRKLSVPKYSVPIPKERLARSSSNEAQKQAPLPSPSYNSPRHYAPPLAFHNTPQPNLNIPSAYNDIEPPRQPGPLPPAYEGDELHYKPDIPPSYNYVQTPQPHPNIPPAYDDIQPIRQPGPLPLAYDNTPEPQYKPAPPPAFDDAPQPAPRPQMPPAFDDVPQPKHYASPPAYYSEDASSSQYSPLIQADAEQQPQPYALSPDDELAPPVHPSRTHMRPLSWVFLLGIILTFILALATNAWIWFVLTFLFFVLFFAFLRK